MTQTKLQILGPYTPDHEGPFCTRDGRKARVICTNKKINLLDDCCVVALVANGSKELTVDYSQSGRFAINDHPYDLMNAREVPVAREFWIYDDRIFASEAAAKANCYWTHRIIHVREVLPGDGE
ncbi:hypothetical protein [Acetobacter senegalensis]|uniref:hypothetical protein n=1 Tax=Acetobacter senegalensis TaxID=446692 RepID=UPI00073ECA59|nr:hypothetical protein [Acetobacter senegalensis]